jgi:hypothetical protein
MALRLRDLDPAAHLASQVRAELLGRLTPLSEIRAVFAELGLQTPRTRKLSLELTVWLVIALSLFADRAVEEVLAKLLHGLRLLCPDEAASQALPTAGAVCYRRLQLGVRPLRLLCRRNCRPLATAATRGAFLEELRLMAIDSHTHDLPDTPANARVFGRPTTDRGPGAFPQVRCVCLVECGTHAVTDAGFWPCRHHESPGARRLLRSVTPDMLVMVDRGLHSYELARAVRQRGAHCLSRISAQVQPRVVRALPDGSQLAELYPSKVPGRHHLPPLAVRLIAFTFTDPDLPGHGTRYRLVTTLLDWERFPALTLARTYHERWEIELTIDEQETHLLRQHHPARPLRSRTPAGVIQELYGVWLGHYLLRMLMHEAALMVDEDPDRLSFTHTLLVVQDAVSDFELAAPVCLPRLYRRLLQELTRKRLPERRHRLCPRVVRCKISPWPLKRAEKHRCRKLKRPPDESICLI